jgi:head-tail adaptor
MAESTTKNDTVTDATEAPKKRGRKATRDPNGQSVSTWLSEATYAEFRKRRFAELLDKDSELVAKAIDVYLKTPVS